MKSVRVRFAPSPTGGLHIGGVRTALYNYLFAKQNNGKFVLRIEDTDQSRFVPGAEEYINACLSWCGLEPDESPSKGGPYGPYRQSDRKEYYLTYAKQLVDSGHAYIAFDTVEEIDAKREQVKAAGEQPFQYNYQTRTHMNNSLRLLPEETQALLDKGTPYVIRIKIDPNETVTFHDIIRGDISVDASTLDDKVLLKADGMPTYHLAVVVDDYLMKISHVLRGEEWLPSAPVHVLLWKYLFGLPAMPQWAHLPLILKPEGHGKLSKRDGDRLGFPVYAMDWTDPQTQELTIGFKERGFLPEAFDNMLALLGWNDGTEKEIYTMPEMIDAFKLEKVHKAGAKFDYEKAKWVNHEWILKEPTARIATVLKPIYEANGFEITNDTQFHEIIGLVQDRCSTGEDFINQSEFFFVRPYDLDVSLITPKWDANKRAFFIDFSNQLKTNTLQTAAEVEAWFKEHAKAQNLKVGDLQFILRIMLVGGKYGPGVFDIVPVLGDGEAAIRIDNALQQLPQ